LSSRCFRSSQKRRAKQANRSQTLPPQAAKGIRGGQEDQIFEEEKAEEDGGLRSEGARQKGCCAEDEEDCQKDRESVEETGGEKDRKSFGREEARQEIGEDDEGSHISFCA
jgi:hypothetical protein